VSKLTKDTKETKDAKDERSTSVQMIEHTFISDDESDLPRNLRQFPKNPEAEPYLKHRR